MGLLVLRAGEGKHRGRTNRRRDRVNGRAWQEMVMFGRPKFSVFRAWVQPSPSRKTNGDSLRPPSVPNKDEEERQVNIKLAVFFSVVALLFVLAAYLGRVQVRVGSNLWPGFQARGH